MQEKKGLVALKGNPITLLGDQLEVGQTAPELCLLNAEFKEVKLSRSKAKVKFISVTFSLETPICDMQTRTFEDAVGKYPNTIAYSVSMDLPFTLARYAKEHPIRNLKLLTDYKDATFGLDYGLLIKENRLLARAVFIIGSDNNLRYVEYVKDISWAPDFGQALNALRAAAAEK
jgi:thiol peroxidase